MTAQPVTVDRTFTRQDGGYGCLAIGPGGVAASFTVPELFGEGTRLLARRVGSQWEYVGRPADARVTP